VLKGSFDQYAESATGKHGTAEVDHAFLTEIERWRDLLAHNIALRNPSLSQRDLNYAVQMTIDRLIFLRICEDRGIEFYGQLQALLNGTETYSRLCQLYRNADDRYNSGLFHFHPEKGQSGVPDALSLGLGLDDKPLKDILSNLYYPESPYEFSVLPADILGQVYEQFLGKVIRLTSAHHAVVEDKPEVKKAGGVFYTPTFIVDYIVKHTLGDLLQNKHPGEVGLGRGAPIRVLDMACGSGSFLLGAYQYLLDWYLNAYAASEPEKWATGRAPQLVQVTHGEWRLTTSERKRILLDHIYGVDIDPQAVEVTKLSLLLKVLEGESQDTVGKQLSLFHQRALPDLGQNIKCGNSLIGPDFYTTQQSTFLDAEEQYRINAFDWKREFAAVFASSGGFDIIIGNPPYVRQEGLGEYKPYFRRTYQVYHGIADLYCYFIEKGITLLKIGGLFGFIVANKWMRANYGEPLRRWLKKQVILEITDFGDLPVFENVTTYPCILRVGIIESDHKPLVTQVKTLCFNNLDEYVEINHYVLDQMKLDDQGWSLVDENCQILLEKLKLKGIPLGEYIDGNIFRGILTGLNEAFVINDATRQDLINADSSSAEIIKPFLIGRDIKRYKQPKCEHYLVLIPNGWTRQQSSNYKDAWCWFNQKFPAIAGYLEPFKEVAEKRYDKGEYWWELRACDYYKEFEKPKIIIPAIVQSANYSYDTQGYYSNDKTSIIVLDSLYVLGLINSKVCDFFLHTIASTKRGGYYEYKPMYVSQLPIVINPSGPSEDHRVSSLVEQMLTLHQQLASVNTPTEKTLLQRQIDATDHQIDSLVYELYSLTEDEIKLVEGR
jgi:hypothetical protein